MRLRLFGQGLMGIAVTSLTTLAIAATINQPSYAGGTIFKCEKRKGVPVTMAQTQDGRKVPMIQWSSQDYFPREWNSERRCYEVSRRFQRSYDNGKLRFIKTGTLKGEPVVCAAVNQSSPCTDSTLLFTLKRGSNPKATLRRLMNRRGLVAGNILNESGGDSMNIDFDMYLNNATVESNSEINRDNRDINE
jgi:Circadian oscillating protein COP23